VHFDTLSTKPPRTSIHFLQNHHPLQYTPSNAALGFEIRLKNGVLFLKSFPHCTVQLFITAEALALQVFL
jgi:hypothetical protein